MIKGFLFCLTIFLSTHVFADESSKNLDQLSSNMNQKLDVVLGCYTVITNSMAGAILGKWLHVMWERGAYVDGYVTPLVDAVKNSESICTEHYDFKSIPEYSALIEMTQQDSYFQRCPTESQEFIQAMDVYLQEIVLQTQEASEVVQ